MFRNRINVVISMAAVTAGLAMTTGIGFAAERGVVSADSLNIRTGPSTSYSIIAKAPKGTVVNIISKNDGWCEVSLPDGVKGWASGGYIDIKEVTQTGKILGDTYLRAKEDWSSEKLELIKKDAKVEVISRGINWTKVRYNGKTGYISNDYVEVSGATSSNGSTSVTQTGKILGDTYLRAKEDWSSEKLELIKKDAKVEVISRGVNWTKVRYNGKTGYISNDYVEVSGATSSNGSTSVTETSKVLEDTYLRAKEDWSSEKLELIKKDTKVEVISRGVNWTKVRYNGKTGYISNDYIENGSTSVVKTGVILEATYLRSEANWSANKLVLLEKDTNVKILSRDENWTKVEYSGQTGYIANAYIKDSTGNSSNSGSNPGSTVTEKIGVVVTDSLNVRKGAGTSYDIVTKVTRWEKVTILDKTNGWFKIKTASGVVGWASSSYIDIIDSTSSDTNSSVSAKIDAVVKLAKAQLGKPYEWGGTGPNSFDCSGLMWYVYKNAAGVDLPRVSRDQAKYGKAVSRENIQIGDLVAFDADKDGVVEHIGMYIGNGEFIHAPKPGDVVKISSLSTNYYKNALVAIRRVLY